ncbi:GAF domain-containing protein [Oceanobacillus salinisoli]|uniref:GAF domain-containing protein n=1 Tax=Oceanobacillus salinisoli TaxID=2678611 RepID=UPI0012E25E77|nr:GAF domain-containing protein [Oceanobacillus salinisoli]
MFETSIYSGDKTKDYELTIKQLEALIEGEQDDIANLSNATALLNQFLTDINWVGFYLWKKDELVLGPFQGLPACVRIGYGKGVCGTAVHERKTQRIANVHAFPGHIACDSASNSEIVIPIMKNSEVYGVLDIDSPSKDRFDEVDQIYLEKFVNVLEKYI